MAFTGNAQLQARAGLMPSRAESHEVATVLLLNHSFLHQDFDVVRGVNAWDGPSLSKATKWHIIPDTKLRISH